MAVRHLLTWVSAAVLLVSLSGAPTVRAEGIGTDIAALNLCLYGDCEARGAFAADPYGWTNPATMPAGTFPFLSRGAFLSGTYYRINVGRIGVNLEDVSITGALSPFVFSVTPIYADGSGALRDPAGVDMSIRTRSVRLAAAVDLERAVGVDGLAIGLLGTVPGTTSDLRFTINGTRVAKAWDDHEVDLTLGVHWRGGRQDWFMAGAFVNGIRNHSTLEQFGVTEHGTTNVWFARFGLSLLPFTPLGLTDGGTPAADFLGSVRLGADVEHRNIAVPGEGASVESLGYFGGDARLLPDAWNPVARLMRVLVIAGVDTSGGWGVGPGLYGNGPLEFLYCNLGTSSRPLVDTLGDRVTVWTANCAVVAPF